MYFSARFVASNREGTREKSLQAYMMTETELANKQFSRCCLETNSNSKIRITIKFKFSIIITEPRKNNSVYPISNNLGPGELL